MKPLSEDIWIFWQYKMEREFQQVETEAKRTLFERHGVLDSHLYRTAGKCTLLRLEPSALGDQEIPFDTQILERESQWSEVIQKMVGTYCAKQLTSTRFRLELQWSYSSLTIPTTGNEAFAVAVRTEMRNRMKENFLGKLFLPRGDLKTIFADVNVIKLLDDDRSLKETNNFCKELAHQGRPYKREHFFEVVRLNGTRLLAACVYAQMPLACLYRLMIDRGVKDADIPLERSHFHDVLGQTLKVNILMIDAFIDYQGSFSAHQFLHDGTRPVFHMIHDRIVVPVMFDQQKDLVGKGGFGEVFKARIHPNHHSYSPNRDEYYAVKRFKAHGPNTDSEFRREESQLQKLYHSPHANITLHLASWSQDGRYYLIFPLADSSLRELLRGPAPELTGANVKWLFSQLNNIVGAVERIHIHKDNAPVPVERLGPPQPTPKQTGFHQDLKPGNILVFNGSDKITDSVLKISDFGTAKLDFVLSGSGLHHGTPRTRNPQGDYEYESPDWAQTQELGRPNDIWSLGCCFLEILLWIFDQGGSHLNDFRVARTVDPPNNIGNTPAFWYRSSSTGMIGLKPVVMNKMRSLQSICQSRGQFGELLRWVKLMLTLKTDERPKVHQVKYAFHAMLIQLEFELQTDMEYYLRDHSNHSEQIAQAGTMQYVTSSRTDSIDKRQIETPNFLMDRPRRGSSHHRGFSEPASQAEHLPKLETHFSDTILLGTHLSVPERQPSPATVRPRSPSIKIDDTDAPENQRTYSPHPIWDDTEQYRAFMSGIQDPPTRQEIPTLRRMRSGSSASMTM